MEHDAQQGEKKEKQISVCESRQCGAHRAPSHSPAIADASFDAPLNPHLFRLTVLSEQPEYITLRISRMSKSLTFWSHSKLNAPPIFADYFFAQIRQNLR